MPTKRNIYVCPKHRDQVLYVEIVDPGRVELFIVSKPEVCPKCKKPYYKHECVLKR